MTTYSPLQLSDYARQAGFTGASQAIIVAIALAESGGQSSIRGKTDPRDRGVLQINSFWHSEVSDNCAFDVACSFREVYRISNGGTNFRAWCTAWSDGACGTRGGTYQGTGSPYQKYLSGLPTGGAAGAPPQPPVTQPVTANTSPLTTWITGMGPFFAWVSNPLRVAKLVVGMILIGLSLYMLTVPGADTKVQNVMKGIPKT